MSKEDFTAGAFLDERGNYVAYIQNKETKEFIYKASYSVKEVAQQIALQKFNDLFPDE